MGMNLDTECWVENEKYYSSDQNEMPKQINPSEKFSCLWYNKTVDKGMTLLSLYFKLGSALKDQEYASRNFFSQIKA